MRRKFLPTLLSFLLATTTLTVLNAADEPAFSAGTQPQLLFDATQISSWTNGTTTTWSNLGSAAASDAILRGNPQYNSTTKLFEFDGTGDYFELPDSTFDYSNGFAIHVFANFGSVRDNWERLVDFADSSQGGGGSAPRYNVFFGRSGTSDQLVFRTFDGFGWDAPQADCVADGIVHNEYHLYSVVVSADGSECTLYRNDIELTANRSSQGADARPDKGGAVRTRDLAFIGKSTFDADQDFEGDIQFVSMFNSPVIPAPSVTSLSTTSGAVAGGTTTTLFGRYFSRATSLTIGDDTLSQQADGTAAGGLAAGEWAYQTNGTIIAKTPQRTLANRTAGAMQVVVTSAQGSSSDEVYFTYRPDFDAPGTSVVVLGELASRSEGKAVTRTTSTPYVTTGTDGRTGQAYTFTSDYNYGNSGAYRYESNESTGGAAGGYDVTTETDATSPTEVVLFSSGTCSHNNAAVNTSYCSVFGPDIYTEPFAATAGQNLSFEWKATGGGDHYEVYAFLVEVDSGGDPLPSDNPGYVDSHTLLAHAVGATQATYITQTATIADDGLYRFRFVNGTYDFTGFKGVGAKMYIKKNVTIAAANSISFTQPSDQIFDGAYNPFSFDVTSSSQAEVTFAATGKCTVATSYSSPTTTVTVTNSGGAGTCTLTATQGASGVYGPAADVTRYFDWRATAAAPSAPTLGAVTGGAGSVSLTFSPPARDGGAPVTNYLVSIDGGAFEALDPATTSSPITISGLDFGTTYSFKLKALNSSGASTESGAKTGGPSSGPPAAPDTPTSLDGAASDDDGDINLTWTAPNANNSAITGYTLRYRIAGSGSSWTAGTDTDGSVTDAQATISGLNSCVAYEFQVLATNALGSSSYSTSTTVTSFSSDDLSSLSSSQLVTAGDTTLSAGTYTLTPDLGNKKGAIWSGYRLDLSKSFCLEADIQLSNAADTTGADGVAFVLQPSDTSSLSSGGGLGYYSGVKPSVAVEFDTYANGSSFGDSASGQDVTLVSLTAAGTADWTAFDQSNYDVTTNGYSLEDGEFHAVRIRYDANQELLTVLVDLNADGDFADTGERVVNSRSADLAQFFTDEASTNYVYWGFTAATGGATNEQAVKNLKSYPLQLAANTSPTATSPGSQTVDVGASKNIAVAIDDSSETTQAQWRLSVASANTSFVTASVSTASATQATVAVTGVSDGDTTITLTATDADGASVSTSFAIRVGAGSPAAPAVVPSGGGSSIGTQTPASSVVVTPLRAPRVLPPTTPAVVPRALQAPVVSPGRGFDPSVGTRATVGGAPATASKRAIPGGVSVQAGAFQFGVTLAETQAGAETSGSSDLSVKSGSAAKVAGSGMLPGSPVQVWLPGRAGSDSRELSRAVVGTDGQVETELTFVAKPSEAPIPIGSQVLQITGYDEDGNLTVVDMPVNIAQGPIVPEPNRDAGALPDLGPGRSLATSAGSPVEVAVVALPVERSVVVGDGSWEMTLEVDDQSGAIEGESESPVIRMEQSSVASASGDGFQPGTTASVWMFSDPTLMATVVVSDDGSFTTEFLVDPQFLPAGDHTLQIQGVGEDGFIKSANLGVLVEEPVVLTSDSASGLLWWVIGAFLVALLLLVIVAVARRKRST